MNTVCNKTILINSALQVRCRSQEELSEDTSPEEMRQRERDLFQNHAELSHLPDEYKGMPALVDKLVKLQGERIHSHLPVLKKQVCSYLISLVVTKL